MKHLKSLALVLAIFFSSNAFSGFLVEPFLGYGFGSGEYKNGTTGVDTNSSALHLGARLGYQVLGFMGGLELRKTSGSYTADKVTSGSLSNSIDSDYSGTEIGMFVGYNLPIMFRFYMGYTFSTTWEIDNGSWRGSLNDELKGNTLTLGAGFTGLSFLSLNLEYRMISFDTFVDSSNASLESSINDESVNEIVIGVSIPLDF